MLLDFADKPALQVRRRPIAPRLGNVQFPFDNAEERMRLRRLLFENRRLVKRLCRDVNRATVDLLDRLEYDQLVTQEIELIRAVACVAGIENYVRCRPITVVCTTFLPRGAFLESVRCGCAFAPIELHRSTAIHLRRLSSKIEPGSSEEERILEREKCASLGDARLLYHREAIIDGVVLRLERRTPRTPRSEEAMPRVHISNESTRSPPLQGTLDNE